MQDDTCILIAIIERAWPKRPVPAAGALAESGRWAAGHRVSIAELVSGPLCAPSTQIRNQKSEIRNQKSEIRNQKSEIRNQKSEGDESCRTKETTKPVSSSRRRPGCRARGVPHPAGPAHRLPQTRVAEPLRKERRARTALPPVRRPPPPPPRNRAQGRQPVPIHRGRRARAPEGLVLRFRRGRMARPLEDRKAAAAERWPGVVQPIFAPGSVDQQPLRTPGQDCVAETL
jgi:hypothetical protein